MNAPTFEYGSDHTAAGAKGNGRSLSQTEIPGFPPSSQEVGQASEWVAPIKKEISRAVVGQEYLIDRLLVGILCGGHVLLEGAPGLAKTLVLKSLAATVQTDFRRIQFTPDMLPADIVGTEVYNPRDLSFDVKHGPVFSNFILADEINRAPAKVQSALLEAMQERQVTIGETTFRLPDPFLVMATQNPIEQEGTYPLPEAQVDRFLLKVVVSYPSLAEERLIIDRLETTLEPPTLSPVVTTRELRQARKTMADMYMDEKIKDYIVHLVQASRDPRAIDPTLTSYIQVGASPRATIGLKTASKAMAFLKGRGFVTPDDVKAVAMDVLRHRIMITYEAEAEGLTSEKLVQSILDAVPVP